MSIRQSCCTSCSASMTHRDATVIPVSGIWSSEAVLTSLSSGERTDCLMHAGHDDGCRGSRAFQSTNNSLPGCSERASSPSQSDDRTINISVDDAGAVSQGAWPCWCCTFGQLLGSCFARHVVVTDAARRLGHTLCGLRSTMPWQDDTNRVCCGRELAPLTSGHCHDAACLRAESYEVDHSRGACSPVSVSLPGSAERAASVVPLVVNSADADGDSVWDAAQHGALPCQLELLVTRFS